MVESIIDLWVEVCPGGWSLKISIQPSAFSNQQSAKGELPRGAPGFCAARYFQPCDPLPAWDWVWDWATQAPRKGHPSATQAWPKGRPWVICKKLFCLQQKCRKCRVG